MRSLHVNKALGPVVSYTVSAIIPNLKPSDVMGKGSDYPDSVSRYVDLPFPKVSELQGDDKNAAWQTFVQTSGPDLHEWSDLYSLNAKIIGNAVDPYDKALRIEMYLRKFFNYSLTPPASKYSSPFAAFLFDTHTGYCQHFAGSMALLLRYNGIPSRIAVGFTTGELHRGVYTVSSKQRPRLGRGLFPHSRMGVLRPHEGEEHTHRGTIVQQSRFHQSLRRHVNDRSQHSHDSACAQPPAQPGPHQ